MSYATTKKRMRPTVTGVQGHASKHHRRRELKQNLRNARLDRRYTGWFYLFHVLKFFKAKHVAKWVFDRNPPRVACALYVNDRFVRNEHIRMNQLHIRVTRVTRKEPATEA